MQKSAIAEELEARLQADVHHYRGKLPERVAIAWRGYFAALLEWGVLDVPGHDRLLSQLPAIPNDPVSDIMRGRA